MSYARLSHCDVYVCLDVAGCLRCCMCALADDFTSKSTDDMVAHLRLHEEAGHDTGGAIEGLVADQVDNDQWMNGEECPACERARYLWTEVDGKGRYVDCERCKGRGVLLPAEAKS